MNPLIPIIGIGALLLMSRKKAAPASSMDAVAVEKFGRLYELTGEEPLNPASNDLKDVVQYFQAVVGTSRVDGVYDAETDAALDDAIAGFI